MIIILIQRKRAWTGKIHFFEMYTSWILFHFFFFVFVHRPSCKHTGFVCWFWCLISGDNTIYFKYIPQTMKLKLVVCLFRGEMGNLVLGWRRGVILQLLFQIQISRWRSCRCKSYMVIPVILWTWLGPILIVFFPRPKIKCSIVESGTW